MGLKKVLSIAAALAVAAFGGVVILGASPQAQEESKTDKQIKALTEKVDKLEKRVAELEKKLAEKRSPAGFEEQLKALLEKFGGEDALGDLQRKLDEFRESMPEMPDFESMPDLFQGLDLESVLEMFKGQFGGELPEFFDGFDMEGLFQQFKGAPDRKPEPRKGPPRRRSI